MGCNSVATNREKEKARDVLERVTLAIETLCVGKGDVRSRLEAAVRYQLSPLREQNFPTGLGCKFRKIIQQSTRYDASDLAAYQTPIYNPYEEGHVHSTMRRIRRSTGQKIACAIWELYSEVKRMAE